MEDLVVLYQKVADMTAPVCGSSDCELFVGSPVRCCQREYCELTRKFALAKYGTKLEETGNKELPFMGENGCTVAPHLRPLCSIHICCFSWARKATKSPDGYVELREKILKAAKDQDKWPLL